MSSGPLFGSGDIDATSDASGRSEYDWGSAKPLGADATDYSEDERVAIGAGWIDAAGCHEIVELARDGRRDNDLYCRVETPTSRKTIADPMRTRVKTLLERDNRGAITLLTPEQFATSYQCDRDLRERVADEDDDIGVTWINGQVVSIREYDEDGELIGRDG